MPSAVAWASAVTFVFVASSPLVLMGFYKMNATTFAILYGVSASGVMLGNYLNGLLVRKLPYLKVMARALVALVLCTLAFTAWTGLQPAVPFQVVVAGLFLVLCCIGMIYPNSVSASLAPFKALSGSASALMGSFMMGISALTTALVGILPAGSSTYMFGLMAVMSILSAWMLRGNPGTAPQPTAETV
jgi:DHA1 family bicyclomycin/chloramphenicol resistance-like MFS transporter